MSMGDLVNMLLCYVCVCVCVCVCVYEYDWFMYVHMLHLYVLKYLMTLHSAVRIPSVSNYALSIRFIIIIIHTLSPAVQLDLFLSPSYTNLSNTNVTTTTNNY